MILRTNILFQIIFLLILNLVILAACNGGKTTGTETKTPLDENAMVEVNPTSTIEPISLPTVDPDVPLAASVNGQPITLDEFQAELERAYAASETGLITFTGEDVLQNMIDELLLVQGATEAGFNPDNTFVKNRLDQLKIDDQALQEWKAKNGYTSETFETAYVRAIASAWMRDQIISSVPSTAEQVHARQILLYNANEAESVYSQLQSGTDFATIAAQYDPVAQGDLGWFPRGYLTVPELDDPIFLLDVGEYTQVTETILGFHIVQVISRDPQRPLSPSAYQNMKVRAIENWLIERRSNSDIIIFKS